MSFTIDDPGIFNQWQEIVEIMAQIMHVPSAIITRFLPPYIEVFKASQNPDNPYREGQKVAMAGHYCEEVITKKHKLLLPNAEKSEHWTNAPELDYGIISYLGYPILLPDGEVFGTICILDNKENHYSQAYETLLLQFKALVETHLILLQQKQTLEKQMQEIKALRGIIPICACCKNIRNDKGYWEKVEAYIESHSEAEFTHGLCEDCAKKLYGNEPWYEGSKLQRYVQGELKRDKQE